MFSKEREASIYIFGDIVAPITKELLGFQSDVSGFSLVQEVKELEVDTIHIHINCYGGVVSEGLAIYNTLRQHPATIITHNDGFCCSAANLVFLAGDQRITSSAAAFFWHAVESENRGNSASMRKSAADLDTLTQATINAYMERLNIPEDEIKAMFDAETWLLPDRALQIGLATAINKDVPSNRAMQSIRQAVVQQAARREERSSVRVGIELQGAAAMQQHLAALQQQVDALHHTLAACSALNAPPPVEPVPADPPPAKQPPEDPPAEDVPVNRLKNFFGANRPESED